METLTARDDLDFNICNAKDKEGKTAFYNACKHENDKISHEDLVRIGALICSSKGIHCSDLLGEEEHKIAQKIFQVLCKQKSARN
mmetsp:Transcript_134761/g.200538  ORF Transcript_134761/g.200538 Transcript_134761/m.200538 type:complete len:85 (+) Transcript_134761:179-433(+)